MAAFLRLCIFLLGANYLLAVSAWSVEEEILNGSDKNTIVGGEPINIDQTPYLAQLLRGENQTCGSSILNKYWIVTAAHCVQNGGNYSILTGSPYRAKGSNRHEIDEILLHESYDKDTFDNDIALIKLKKPIKFNSKQKRIPISKERPAPGDEITLAGFGKTGTGEASSNVLLSTVVPVISKTKCYPPYLEMGDKLTDNMFCAGDGEHDTCQGDSGGPAVIKDKLVGVVSSGYECASEKFPGVYTQIANYIDWIEENTGLKI